MQSASIEANRRKCPPSSRRSPSWQRYAFLGFCKSLFSKIVTSWSRAQRFEFLLSGSILRCRCCGLRYAMQLSLVKHRSEVISLVRSAVYEKCFLCNRILYLMALSASVLGVTLHTLNFHSLDHRHSLPHDCYPRQHCRYLHGRRFRTSPSYQCARFGIIATWLPWLPGVTSFYDLVRGGLWSAFYV